MASLLLLKYTKHTPLSGISNKLPLNLKCPFPWCPHTIFKSLFKNPLVYCCSLEDSVLQISCVDIQTPEMVVLGGGDLCKIFRSWGRSSHEWDYCFYETDLTENTLALSACEYTRRSLGVGRGHSSSLASTLISDFPSPGLWKLISV